MRYFSGKSLGENYVTLSPRHRKFDLLFKFDSHKEAERYYRLFDYENRKMILQRIKIFFCRHKDNYELDIESKLYHYIHCPNCNRAIYINDESEEEREIRMKEARKLFHKSEIDELKGLLIEKAMSLCD